MSVVADCQRGSIGRAVAEGKVFPVVLPLLLQLLLPLLLTPQSIVSFEET
jgi:hypothetical protein